MMTARPTPKRILVVTGGLAAAGAVLGAGLGVLGRWMVSAFAYPCWGSEGVLRVSEGLLPCPGPITISNLVWHARIGEAFGFVAAPLLGWFVLRRVPLGQAFGGLVLGAICGGLCGSWFAAGSGAFVTAVLMSVIYRPAT